jgi:hypothetical protein
MNITPLMDARILGDPQPHPCSLCGQLIEAGSRHVMRMGRMDGAIQSWCMHPECHRRFPAEEIPRPVCRTEELPRGVAAEA